MKYQRKPQIVEAVQFTYIPKGIEDLRKLVSPLICTVAKESKPNSKGTACIELSDNGTIQVWEGQVVVKDEQGWIDCMSLALFDNTYEKLEEKQND